MKRAVLAVLLVASLACSPYPTVTFTVTMQDGTTRTIDGERYSWNTGCVNIYDGGDFGRAIATFCGVKEITSKPKGVQ